MRLYQKSAAFHHLFAVEPDVEVAANAIDVRFGNPVRSSVFGVRMAEGDVDTWNFFVLQNVPDDMLASRVGADRKFADAIAVFVGAGVGAEFGTQIKVLGQQRSDALVLPFDRERIG